ncbi:argininosuccinate lyase [Pseudomonas frederiksbergensis]
MSQSTDRLWGARFKSGPSEALAALSRCPERYFRLTPYDLAGSKAHARELQRAGLLSEQETQTMLDALERIGDDFRAGSIAPTLDDEDVHTFIERLLTERLGTLGGKLRAGRSRNDQTANDLRLFLRDHVRTLAVEVLALQQALVDQAEQHIESICPGFTHLQQAQPIVFAHHLLAHAQSMLRDVQRLVDWDVRTSLSPLGAAAMAGSAIARLPQQSAKEMGYSGVCETPSTPWPAAITLPSFCLSPACWGSTFPASPKSSACGRRGNFAGSRWTMPTPPAVRSCRRRKTRTSPNWLGARPVA